MSLAQVNDPLRSFQRDVSLDGIRLVAMVFVIFIHVSGKGFPTMGRGWWAVNAYESISRVSVPLFFMVTGALLASRQHGVISILQRIWRIALPLFAWSLIFLLYYKSTGIHISAWALKIIKGPVANHLWYLYTLIGAYFFLPVVAGFFRGSSTQLILLSIGAWFIGESVGPLVYSLEGTSLLGISFDFLSLYAGYMVIGATLYWRCDGRTPKFCLAVSVWLICTALTALLTWFRSVNTGGSVTNFYEYSSPLVVVATIAAFISIRAGIKAVIDQYPAIEPVVIYSGQVSFGVYLIHPLVIWILDGWGVDYKTFNPWICIPLVSVIVFAICGLIVRVMQKLPYIRSIVPS